MRDWLRQFLPQRDDQMKPENTPERVDQYLREQEKKREDARKRLTAVDLRYRQYLTGQRAPK